MVFEVLSGGAFLKSLSLRLIGQRKFGTVQGEARLLVNDGTLRLTPIRDASVREGTVMQGGVTDLRSNADMSFVNRTSDLIARTIAIRLRFS